MRRFLIMSGIILTGLVVICGAVLARFFRALTSADPYPAFMTDYQLKGSRSYQEAARTFSEFVVKTFPLGSDAKDAIAQATRGGFQLTTSTSDSFELLWKRHAGPCEERYLIVIDQIADGTIAKDNWPASSDLPLSNSISIGYDANVAIQRARR